MISALYNLSLPVFNEEWHPWDNVVGRRPGGPIRDGTAGRVPGAPLRWIYKVLINECLSSIPSRNDSTQNSL